MNDSTQDDLPVNLKAENEMLRDRVMDLEIDLNRLTSLFGYGVEEVTKVVAEIRALKAKEGDVSVNAMLAAALKIHPDLAMARDAIDRVLLAESGRPSTINVDGLLLFDVKSPNSNHNVEVRAVERAPVVDWIKQCFGRGFYKR